MLSSMRTLSKSIVSKALMFLLVISFGVWGIGDIMNSSGPGYAAKVGNETISLGEFQQQRAQVARQLEALNIKNLPAGQLELSVIRQLVQQKLTLQFMRDMGLFVNDATVSRFIADLPEFKDESGVFSADAFRAVLAHQRLSEQAFVDQIRNDIAGRFLVESLAMQDATTPSSLLMLEAMSHAQTRDAVLLTIPAHSAMDTKNEAALQAFYEENKSVLYLRPETRTLEYVVLNERDIDALLEAAITDALLGEARATRTGSSDATLRAQLKQEQRDSVMQTLSNTIEDALAAGKPIAEAFRSAGIHAAPRTLDQARADMATTGGDDISRTVVEQGFGLNEGEISRLIRSPQGALLMVAVKTVQPAAPKPYEEVKADVGTRLARQLAREAAVAKAQTVKAALAKSPNWQTVAAEHALSSRVISRLARPVESKPATVNGVPPALQHAIFERAVGEVAGPLTLDNGDQLLALITQAHLPDRAAIKTTGADKRVPIAQTTAEAIEAEAFQAFAAKHKVTLNPALLRATASEE
ncbi:MAG: SurA N-terminal domain-containing protein [Alphaproteobacteria bacterium]|nr:SurA N-terminal domain-containing protein [Alphaproteobacteria bacterium]